MFVLFCFCFRFLIYWEEDMSQRRRIESVNQYSKIAVILSVWYTIHLQCHLICLYIYRSAIAIDYSVIGVHYMTPTTDNRIVHYRLQCVYFVIYRRRSVFSCICPPLYRVLWPFHGPQNILYQMFPWSHCQFKSPHQNILTPPNTDMRKMLVYLYCTISMIISESHGPLFIIYQTVKN